MRSSELEVQRGGESGRRTRSIILRLFYAGWSVYSIIIIIMIII